MWAQKSKPFETLPARWPPSVCEASEHSCLMRSRIFEASSVSQTNDPLQLIFNPLKGSRYSSVKKQNTQPETWYLREEKIFNYWFGLSIFKHQFMSSLLGRNAKGSACTVT